MYYFERQCCLVNCNAYKFGFRLLRIYLVCITPCIIYASNHNWSKYECNEYLYYFGCYINPDHINNDNNQEVKQKPMAKGGEYERA